MLEIWQKGVCVDQHNLVVGLRSTHFSGGALRLNGRDFSIQCIQINRPCDFNLSAWRSLGFNAVLCKDDNEAFLTAADRLGMLVIVSASADIRPGELLQQHASCLGLLVASETVDAYLAMHKAHGATKKVALGLRVNQELENLPDCVDFIVCPEKMAANLIRFQRPMLLEKKHPGRQEDKNKVTSNERFVFGFVEQPPGAGDNSEEQRSSS
jgi:hypothetical protein